MPRLIITDALGHQLIATRIDDGYTVAELRHLAGVEAEMHAATRGGATWRILDAQGREVASGEATAPRRLGLLAVGTPVLYAEADSGGAGLQVYGSIRAIQSGYYLVTVDHVDSGGRPVPIGALAELRMPVDTPTAGAAHTLEAVPLAHQVAAE